MDSIPEKPPGRRPSKIRQDRARRKRVALLFAAMRCIDRFGIAATTMEAVAAEGGVTRVTIYREFGSRGAMMRAIIEYRFAAFNRRFLHWTPIKAPLDELLEQYLVAAVHIALRNPVTRQVVHGGLDFARPGDPIHGLAEEMWRPLLARARGCGRIAHSLEDAAIVQWILVMQVTLCRMALDTGMSENQVRQTICSFILPAFARDEGRGKGREPVHGKALAAPAG
jgi:AcrR family transcriptional regulator